MNDHMHVLQPGTPRDRAILLNKGKDGRDDYYWCHPETHHALWAYNPHRHIDTPLVPPVIPRTPTELPWLPRKRPNKRAPWVDPRIQNEIIQRAAPTYIGGVDGTASAAGTVATSAPYTPTANNCLAGFVTTPTAITVSTVADGTNIYVLGTAGNNASGARVTPFYANNVRSAALTITATLSGTAASAAIAVTEYSGVGSIAENRTLIDATIQALGNGTAVTASPTPQQSDSLHLSGVGDLTGGITYTATGSITRRRSVTSPVGLAVGEQIGSSTSINALASAWTASGTVQWTEVVIVLRAAGTQPSLNARLTSSASAASITSGSFGTTIGTLMLASVQTASASVTTSTVASLNGDTWTKAAAAPNASGGELSVWWAFTVSANSNTVTATFVGGSAASTIVITALLGVLPSANPIDIALPATGNGTAVSVGPSTSTAIAAETAVLIVGTPGATGTNTNQAGTTFAGGASSATSSLLIEHLVVNAKGAQTMTATLGATQQWSAILLTVKTGGVSILQSSTQTVAGNPSKAIAPFFNEQPGNTLILAVNAGGGKTVSTVTDTQGNTWNKVEDAVNAGNVDISLWYAKSIVGGTNSITVTYNLSTNGSMFLYELSGLDASVGFDVGSTFTGNTQSIALTNPTPNYLFRVVIVAGGDTGTGKAYTPVAPFVQTTVPTTTTADLMSAICAVFEPGVVPTGTSTTLAIPGGANVQAVGVIAAFKIAGSPTYFSRTLAETATATDAAIRQGVFGRTNAETAAATDAASRLLAAIRTAAETAAAADAISRQGTFSRTGAETATATDSAGRHGVFSRILPETSTAADTLSRIYGQIRTIAETATTVDAISRSIGHVRVIADTAAAIDALARSMGMRRTIAETARAADAIARRGVFSRALAETAHVADSARVSLLRRIGAGAIAVWAKVKTLLLTRTAAKTAIAVTSEVQTVLTVWTSQSPSATRTHMDETTIFEQGDVVKVYGSLSDPDTSAAITPSALHFVVQGPDGSIVARYTLGVDSQLTLVSTGLYLALVDTSAIGGPYMCRFYNPSGTGQVSKTIQFFVNPASLV